MAEEHNNADEEKRKKPQIVISDHRHSREMQAGEEPEQAPEAEPVEPSPREELTVEFPAEKPEADPPASPVETPPVEAPPAEATPAEPAAEQSVEAEQLRALFGAGVDYYLRGQFGLLANFALIAMGRAPNPATGLVSVELDKAKLAIDVLEYITDRLQSFVPEKEQAEIKSAVNELKYVFMQSMGDKPAPGEPS